jgi:hypothetical protein
MWAGTAKRSWAGTFRGHFTLMLINLGHRRLLFRLSSLQDMQSVVRPRAGFRTSPERSIAFRLWRVPDISA